MVGSDLQKIILIFELNIKARRRENFVSFFGQTGVTVQMETPYNSGMMQSTAKLL